MGEKVDRAGFLRRLFFVDSGTQAARALRGEGSYPTGRIPFTFLRPPGAPLEPQFLSRCTRCDLCREACPEKILVPAQEPLMGRGTPVIDPDLGPCTLCLKCVEACPDGALLLDEDRRMGKAVWHAETCLSSRIVACVKCVEACPVGPSAIQILPGKGVEIYPDGCTGCGFCVRACPTEPRSLHLQGRPPMPLRGHPPVPTRRHG
ncbi:MAG: 4Fe-4S dicluster domain-containing protein [Acidobacteriota bacterium]